MVIRKGSVYWVNFSPAKGSEPMGKRPGLVMQNDLLNDSKLNTVIVIAITSTLKFGELPGNVRLHKGEANLPKPSVINMTQITTSMMIVWCHLQLALLVGIIMMTYPPHLLQMKPMLEALLVLLLQINGQWTL